MSVCDSELDVGGLMVAKPICFLAASQILDRSGLHIWICKYRPRSNDSADVEPGIRVCISELRIRITDDKSNARVNPGM